MKRFSNALLALAAVAVLSSCGDDSKNAPAPAAAAPVKKAAPAVTAAAPTGPAYVYAYNPLAKRDPFRSPVPEMPRGGDGRGSCSEPLCQWDIDQLNLVAVVTGDANPLAMVEDPLGRGYIIRRNTRMGKQGGKVTNILRDSVTVTEFFQQPDGKVTPQPHSIKLKADQQLTPALDMASNKFVQ